MSPVRTLSRSFPKLTEAQISALDRLSDQCPGIKVIAWADGGPMIEYPNGYRRIVNAKGRVF